MSTKTLPEPMILAGDRPRTRAHDPEPAHEAADSNDVHGSKQAVLIILTLCGPRDDFEIERIHRASGWERKYSRSRLRAARSALVRDGLAEFTGYFHLSPSGKRTRVWVLS